MSLQRYGEYLAGGPMDVDPVRFYNTAKEAYQKSHWGRYQNQREKDIDDIKQWEKKRKGKGDPAPKVTKKRLLPIKMSTNMSTINQLAGRATMKRKNRKAGKPKGSKKPVRVSKRLRKKIKEVVKEQKVYGEYRSNIIGTIGASITTAQPGAYSLGSMSYTPAYFPLDSNTNGNNYSHWACLMQDLNSVVNTSLVAKDSLVFFTPLQIKNAASVLWNNKTNTSRADAFSESGNITTRISSNAPDLTHPANLVVDVINSFAKFTFKNNSSRAVTLKIKHCVPKTKVALSSPLNAYIDGVTTDISTNGPIQHYPNSAAETIVSPIVEWKKVPSFNSMYRYETVDILIKPGETCQHSLQGPKNFVIDYSKMFVNAQDTTGYLARGSVAVVISVLPDLVTSDFDSSNIKQWSSHFINVHGTTGTETALRGKVTCPIAVEIEEVYKLRMPEPVGAQINGLAAGNMQIMTHRRPRKAFFNFGSFAYTESTLGKYGVRDEEMPTSTVGNETNPNI